jgi:putative oxidoreductase
MVGGGAAGIHGDLTMTPLDSSRRNGVALAISLVLTAVFIYAGIDKIHDPFQFADNISGFAILPAVLINLLALGLPPFEVGCALLLLAPWTRRVGALAIAVISVMFFTALASALLRGLTLDCGCFGAGAPSRPRMWVELALDLLLLSGALFVYLSGIARLQERIE